MTDRELMQKALEALEFLYGWTPDTDPVVDAAITTLRERLAQPEQEPVAWLYRDSWGVMKLLQTMPPPVGAFPVYTTPPQRKPLTDEEILTVARNHYNSHQRAEISFARAIEAAHGIKGGS